MVVTQVQAAEVGHGDIAQICDVTACQAEMDQHCVLRQRSQRHPAVAGVQVAQLHVFLRGERLTADKGPAKARALRGADQLTNLLGTVQLTELLGTGQLTELLVVMLWTLNLSVTNVLSVETHCGTSTAVKPRTRVAVAASFVLAARTVVDTVTPDVDRQTVAVNWTLEVCFRTGYCVLHGLIFRVWIRYSLEKNHFGWRVG